MNSSENTTFDNSMNNSITPAQNDSQPTSPDRTSTPVPAADPTDHNHCSNDVKTSTTSAPASPGREKSPSWEPQTNTNSNDANDANDSDVRQNFDSCKIVKHTKCFTKLTLFHQSFGGR